MDIVYRSNKGEISRNEAITLLDSGVGISVIGVFPSVCHRIICFGNVEEFGTAKLYISMAEFVLRDEGVSGYIERGEVAQEPKGLLSRMMEYIHRRVKWISSI